MLTRQITKEFQLGGELFHQTGSTGSPATTSVGMGAIYDLSDTYHLLAYVRRGVQNTQETDRYSWYGAILFTF